jgi:hypothetical protein
MAPQVCLAAMLIFAATVIAVVVPLSLLILRTQGERTARNGNQQMFVQGIAVSA